MTKILPPTFANLITIDEVFHNYGFVYMVKVEINGQNRLYIGQKCFHDTKHPWQTYTTSSKVVKGMIAKGCVVDYAIIQLCRTKTELTACENKYIVSTWKKLADVGKLYLSLNFAVSRAKRDRVLRGIGVDLKLANCSIVKQYSNQKESN